MSCSSSSSSSPQSTIDLDDEVVICNLSSSSIVDETSSSGGKTIVTSSSATNFQQHTEQIMNNSKDAVARDNNDDDDNSEKRNDDEQNVNVNNNLLITSENRNTEPCEPLKILKFIECLSSTTNSIEMQIMINKYLQDITNSSYVFLVPLLPSSEEGLVQVIGDKKLDKEIRFSVPAEDVQNSTVEEGFHVLVKEPTISLAEIIKMVVGQEKHTLVFNIKNTKLLPSNSVRHTSLYVCIAGDISSTETYGYYIKETFRYILGHLSTSFYLFEEKLVRNQCQNLLQVARRLLSQIGDLGQLLRGVMAEAKNMTSAERCSLFLIDEYTGELVSKVFDGDEATHEVRIDKGKGIAGHVLQTGKLLNIRDAYQHPLFYKGVDEQTGFKTRNILCFPICDEENIIGVAQLCNKLDGFHFDKCDEQIATAFSIYCGISIMHSLVHKQVQKAEARHKLSQELLIYHMKVPEDEVRMLQASMENDETKVKISNFHAFSYNPRDTERSITVQLSMEMFMDLNLVQTFHIREEKLARFLLIVQKGYRDTIPYHNWTHAFSVAHFAYTLLMNLELMKNEYLSDLEGLSLLLSCFCHDLDHRGTNNNYQVEAKSSLASLYSSEGSVNERHHLSQAICILNEDNCKILDSLTEDQFKECIDSLRELILATDLAHHFKIFKDLKKLTRENIKDVENRRLLMSLLMTCCDLSDQVRPWATNQTVANLVYAEFFAQGDLERQMGLAPHEMMDRQKACIPELQIEFIATVVRPTFEILTNLFPETLQFIDTIDRNRAQWVAMRDSYQNCSKI